MIGEKFFISLLIKSKLWLRNFYIINNKKTNDNWLTKFAIVHRINKNLNWIEWNEKVVYDIKKQKTTWIFCNMMTAKKRNFNVIISLLKKKFSVWNCKNIKHIPIMKTSTKKISSDNNNYWAYKQ